MAKENPWFKFEPAEWKLGRIQRQSPAVKSVFLDILCQYWHNKCEMTLGDARLDFGDENIDILLKNKMIKNHEGDNISISFLDEQMVGIKKTSKKASEAGLVSAAKRKAKAEQESNDTSTTVERPLNHSLTEETRRDDTKQEETIKDNITEEETNNILKVYGIYPPTCPNRGINLKSQKDREDIKRLILEHLRDRKELVKVTEPIRVYMRGCKKNWYLTFKELLLDLPEYYKKVERVSL